MKRIKENFVRKSLKKKGKQIKIDEFPIKKDTTHEDLDLNLFIKDEKEIPTEKD